MELYICKTLNLGQGDVHRMVTLTLPPVLLEAQRFGGGKGGSGGIQTPLSVLCRSVVGTS